MLHLIYITSLRQSIKVSIVSSIDFDRFSSHAFFQLLLTEEFYDVDDPLTGFKFILFFTEFFKNILFCYCYTDLYLLLL